MSHPHVSQRACARTQEKVMVNKVILVGNLTRDAESLAGSRGPVTRMRLATGVHWRDNEGNRHEATEFHSLVVFNRLAEICGQYCLRGRRIYIEGRLRTREYDGADGLRRTSTEVVVETMRLLDRREHEEPVDGTASGGALIPAATGDDTVHGPTEDEESEDDAHDDAPLLATAGAR
jgi:single-strand DNA-binding protein